MRWASACLKDCRVEFFDIVRLIESKSLIAIIPESVYGVTAELKKMQIGS